MASILLDGYYATGPTESEDWYGGVRVVETVFHYLRFYDDGRYLHCYRDHDFAFWDFAESITADLFADAMRDRAPRIGDSDPMCLAGTFSVADQIVTRVLAPDWTGGETWRWQYQIHDDRLAPLDSDADVMLFCPKPRP